MGENSAPEGPRFTVRPTSKQPRLDQKDSFRIFLSASSLIQCKLRVGDACRVQVANGVVPAKTAIAWSATDKIPDTVVQISKLLQEQYALKLGEKVYITKTAEPLAAVGVATLEECAQSAGAGVIAEDDKMYWEWGLEYPLCKAEIITVGMVVEQELKGCRRAFRVVDIETAAGMSSSNTIAQFVGTSKTRIGSKKVMGKEVWKGLTVDTAGIGGLSTQIRQIDEKLRDFSLESQGIAMPSFYKSSGGILFHGPKGTGKSILLSRLETSGWHKVLRVNSSVISRASGDSEATLRKTFAEALRFQPSLIAIDQLDFIAPKRGSGDSSSSLASALCECLDSLQDSHVLVAACTRHPNDVDDTLRTPHRLGTEIDLPVPNAKDRREILFALRGTATEPSDALLNEIATKTHGYVGADLFSLLQLCCRKALSRQLSALAVEDEMTMSRQLSVLTVDDEAATNGGEGSQETKEPVSIQISEEDVSQALLETRPTAMREVFLETPQVKWSDIGGQHAIKKRLRQSVERPIKVRITCHCCLFWFRV